VKISYGSKGIAAHALFYDFPRLSLSWGYRFIKLDVYWNSFQRSLKHTFGKDNRNAFKTICGGKSEESHALKKEHGMAL